MCFTISHIWLSQKNTTLKQFNVYQDFIIFVYLIISIMKWYSIINSVMIVEHSSIEINNLNLKNISHNL